MREDQGYKGTASSLVSLPSKIGEAPQIINPSSDKDCVWKVCKRKEVLRKMCEDWGSNM